MGWTGRDGMQHLQAANVLHMLGQRCEDNGCRRCKPQSKVVQAKATVRHGTYETTVSVPRAARLPLVQWHEDRTAGRYGTVAVVAVETVSINRVKLRDERAQARAKAKERTEHAEIAAMYTPSPQRLASIAAMYGGGKVGKAMASSVGVTQRRLYRGDPLS